MQTDGWVVVGLDNGGNKNNATVLDASGRFLVEELLESPSRVTEGPDVAIEALVLSFEDVLRRTGIARERVRGVGLDTPGPASAEGVISARGSTNFAHPGWRNYDFRGALEKRLALPVVYNNDGNAAALYAHYQLFGPTAPQRASISAIIGTGLGGGVIEKGQVIKGAAGFAGRAGPRPRPDAWPPRAGAAPAALQLRLRRRRGERRLAHRHREEPAALLAEPLPRPRAGEGRLAGQGGEARAGLRGERRPHGAGRIRAAGEGSRAALHDCRELHRPRRLLPRRGCRRGRAPLPRVVPRQGAREHDAQGGAGCRWCASRSCPTSTWPEPEAPRSPPSSASTPAEGRAVHASPVGHPRHGARPRARVARARDRGPAPLARGGRPRLDARRHGRDALLHGARAPHARPRDGQGHRGPAELAHPAGLGRRGPPVRLLRGSGRPHPRAHGLDPRLLAGERGVRPFHEHPPARDVPVRARPRDGRRVDDRSRAHRRDLAGGAPWEGARPDAVDVGDRRDDRGRRRRPRPADLRLARGLLRGRAAGPRRVLDPAGRAGVRDLAAPAAEPGARARSGSSGARTCAATGSWPPP